MGNLLERRPDLTKEQLAHTCLLMERHVLDCLVTQYESLENSLHLPDENDRHVLAAAIKCRAEVIVTKNLRDFPAEILNEFDIEAQHPDEFISNLLDLSPTKVCASVKKCRQRFRNPSFNPDSYLDVLARQELPETVSLLRDMAVLL